jgi:YidC/Oxa1 family membrane protein insertase
MTILRDWKNYRRFQKLTADQRNIVFYSESKQDWHHFEPILAHLTGQLSRTVCYITSDHTDFGLNQGTRELLPFCIGEGVLRTLLFQMLKADVMVLTLMDLNNFELKRSVYPVHYIYLFHAMGSTHMVDFENSYDHYDSIFCVGPHHVEEIRKREALASLPAKHLFEHGYHRLEQLIEMGARHGRQGAPDDGKTVLIAPTWGEHSIFNTCGEILIRVLLDAGYRVVMRPHYHTLKTTPAVIDALVMQFREHPKFQYVELMGETDSLLTSDILVCDWSAMAIEYALGLEKPVLFIDLPRRIRNPHYQALGIEPFEAFIRQEVGSVLPPDQISAAPQQIGRLLEAPEQFRDRIKALRQQWVFNLGHSVTAAASEIARIADQKAQERRARPAEYVKG